MNISLREVICTSRDGDRFWRMPEVYVRGSCIKYLRIPDEVIEEVKDEINARRRQSQGRGGYNSSRGRGRVNYGGGRGTGPRNMPENHHVPGSS